MRLESLGQRARVNDNSLDGQWLKENEVNELKNHYRQSDSLNNQENITDNWLENLEVIDNTTDVSADNSISLEDAFEVSLDKYLSSADDRCKALSELEKSKSFLEQRLIDSGFYDDNEISNGRSR